MRERSARVRGAGPVRARRVAHGSVHTIRMRASFFFFLEAADALASSFEASAGAFFLNVIFMAPVLSFAFPSTKVKA